MLVYLAHPYSPPDWYVSDVHRMCRMRENVESSRSLAYYLFEAGHTVINPLALSEYNEHACSERVWMRHDFRLIRACEALILSPGWKGSKGCVKEHRYARLLGMPIATISMSGEVTWL